MTTKREQLAEVFRDTQAFYKENRLLSKAVEDGIKNTVFYPENDYPELPEIKDREGAVTVSKSKTFEAAIRHHNAQPDKKIAVLNFASATNPGGGVKTGSSAQEESLCRCSTLFPALDQKRLWDCYYSVNRNLSDPLHTDACIYTPGIVICKTDESIPRRLRDDRFVSVDVITCAAPNLRRIISNIHNPETGEAVRISNNELFDIHIKRARHILHIAAANSVDIIILGAFGCGAFENDPDVVAKAYCEALREYGKYFDLIDFAIYCREWETENYDAFKRQLKI